MSDVGEHSQAALSSRQQSDRMAMLIPCFFWRSPDDVEPQDKVSKNKRHRKDKRESEPGA